MAGVLVVATDKASSWRKSERERNFEPEAAGVDAARQKAGDDAARIIAPLGRAGFDGRGQINRRHFLLQRAAERDDVFAVHRSVGGHDAVKLNRHRQHKAVVVIGVFADDVDAARRGGDPARRAAVDFLKFSGNVGGEFLEIHKLTVGRWNSGVGGGSGDAAPAEHSGDRLRQPVAGRFRRKIILPVDFFCREWHRAASTRQKPAARRPRRG